MPLTTVDPEMLTLSKPFPNISVNTSVLTGSYIDNGTADRFSIRSLSGDTFNARTANILYQTTLDADITNVEAISAKVTDAFVTTLTSQVNYLGSVFVENISATNIAALNFATQNVSNITVSNNISATTGAFANITSNNANIVTSNTHIAQVSSLNATISILGNAQANNAQVFQSVNANRLVAPTVHTSTLTSTSIQTDSIDARTTCSVPILSSQVFETDEVLSDVIFNNTLFSETAQISSLVVNSLTATDNLFFENPQYQLNIGSINSSSGNITNNLNVGEDITSTGIQSVSGTITSFTCVSADIQEIISTSNINGIRIESSDEDSLQINNAFIVPFTTLVESLCANVLIGTNSLYGAVSAEYNTTLGVKTLCACAISVNNTAVGYNAGSYLLSGTNVTVVGYDAQPASEYSNNEITLGNGDITTLRCNAGAITTLSDKRDKTNIQPLPVGLHFITDIQPTKFTWKPRSEYVKKDFDDSGFIAQDLQEVINKYDAKYLHLVNDINPEHLEVTPAKLIPVLVKAVQELNEEVQLLKQQLNNKN